MREPTIKRCPNCRKTTVFLPTRWDDGSEAWECTNCHIKLDSLQFNLDQLLSTTDR